jgi:hypothetical protein
MASFLAMALIQRDHPVLGTLRWDDQYEWWEVEVDFADSQRVALWLCAEKEYKVFAEPEELFTAGAKYLAWAKVAEPLCRNHIADELLDCYNENWANADCDLEEQPPGVLTREEFLRAIRPDTIQLHPAGNAVWSYGHDCLFGDHVIQVWVNKEGVFSGAHLAG